MKKIAFVFPGQGAGFEKMGVDFYENFGKVKQLCDLADATLTNKPFQNCINMTAEELNITRNCQPATYLHSAICLQALAELNIPYSGVCGFSLGELTALYASGMVNFEDGLKIVDKRAQYMQQAAENSNSGMYAILGLNRNIISEICERANGYVVPVNFNCPTQTVIAGEYPYIDKVANKCVESGAIKAVKLKVSAGFHSKLMDGASVNFYEDIKTISFNKPNIEVYSCVNADKLASDTTIADYLQQQMVSAVEFERCITKMIADGYDTFIEVGPGKTLCGLIKKIDRSVTAFNVQDIATLEKLKEQLAL